LVKIHKTVEKGQYRGGEIWGNSPRTNQWGERAGVGSGAGRISIGAKRTYSQGGTSESSKLWGFSVNGVKLVGRVGERIMKAVRGAAAFAQVARE